MTDEIEYNLTEFCRVMELDVDHVRELVSLGILEPVSRRNYWFFSTAEVMRCAKAERLIHDLDLDLHSAALALDLMDRNTRLQRRIAYLEQLVSRLR